MDEDTFEDTPYFILPIKKEVSILPSQLNRNMEESLLKNIKKKIEGTKKYCNPNLFKI